eukprot:754385-Hanusia_phi.AAC.1
MAGVRSLPQDHASDHLRQGERRSGKESQAELVRQDSPAVVEGRVAVCQSLSGASLPPPPPPAAASGCGPAQLL